MSELGLTFLNTSQWTSKQNKSLPTRTLNQIISNVSGFQVKCKLLVKYVIIIYSLGSEYEKFDI